MRKGFTLVEIMVVIIILPFVLFLLDGLFGTLLTEIPRSWRTAQQSTTLLNLLEQIHQDVGEAKGLPAEFAGRTAGDGLLLVELPEGVISYQIKEDRVTRSKLTSAPGGEAVPALRPAGILPAAGNKGKMPSPREVEQERVWSEPNSKIEWKVWQKDGARYAVDVKTHVELKVHDRLEKKMARAHVFYGGVLR